MWLFAIGDEELRSISVWAIISHRYNTSNTVLKKTHQSINLIVVFFVCFWVFFEIKSHSVTQTGVQWHNLGLLTATSTFWVAVILLPLPPK